MLDYVTLSCIHLEHVYLNYVHLEHISHKEPICQDVIGGLYPTVTPSEPIPPLDPDNKHEHDIWWEIVDKDGNHIYSNDLFELLVRDSHEHDIWYELMDKDDNHIYSSDFQELLAKGQEDPLLTY